MGHRILHLLSSCPSVGDLSQGIAVHRHARALVDAGEPVWLAIVPFWLTAAGPFPRPNLATVAAANYPDLREVDGVAICVFDQLDQLDQVAGELLAFAQAVRPTVLHYHHWHYCELAHFVAAALGIPVVFTAHLPFGDPATSAYRGADDEPVKRAIARAERFIVFVEDGKRRIERWLGEPASHVRVVGHGLEDRADIRAIADARRERTPVTALFVGRFVPEKGIEDLIEAIPAALEACPTLRFVLVGYREGFNHRTPEQLLAPLLPGARERVRIVPWMDRAGVERELEGADLLVAPSRFESFGMAVAEAMLFGLAIVATEVEGFRAIVEPAGAGVLVSPGDPNRLRAEIVALARDPERRLALGRRGAAHARERLAWGPVTTAMLEVYAELRSSSI